MSRVIADLEQRQLRTNLPPFKAGDTVRVHFQVIEGNRRRTQVFEGIVLKRQGSGARETFTVRKLSFGVGVERTFPVHSPIIGKIELDRLGDAGRTVGGDEQRVIQSAPKSRRCLFFGVDRKSSAHGRMTGLTRCGHSPHESPIQAARIL